MEANRATFRSGAMHWLTHNAIADMPGPRYLLLYGSLVLITIVFVRIRVRRLDPSLELDPPTVPGKLGAHQIAHLRGGAREGACRGPLRPLPKRLSPDHPGRSGRADDRSR